MQNATSTTSTAQNNAAAAAAETAENAENENAETRSVTFSDNVSDSDSSRTLAGSTAPSRVHPQDTVSEAESTASSGYGAIIPRPPRASPLAPAFSRPVDGVCLAAALVQHGRALPESLVLETTLGPANSVAASVSGSLEGATLLGSVVSWAPGDLEDVTVSGAAMVGHEDALGISNLTITPARAQPSEVEHPTPADLAASTGKLLKSILKPSRSSHATEAERRAAATTDSEALAAPVQSPVTAATPPGVFEHTFWMDNVREDLGRSLLRMGQLARDLHMTDPSKSVEQHYEEEVRSLLAQGPFQYDGQKK